jgi:hypothetical protein
MKKRYLIGIDPGTQTGLAVWDREKQAYKEICTLPLHLALIKVQSLAEYWLGKYQLCLYVENPNTWKPFGQSSRNRLQGAGSIKRDYAIWKEFAEYYKIELIPVRLQGTLKKLTPARFKLITGWDARTSAHARDAAMMVYNR